MVRFLRPTLLGVVLVDVPVFIGIVAAGLVWGFKDSLAAYLAWREERPWTFLVSLALVIAFVAWRHRRFQAKADKSARPSPG